MSWHGNRKLGFLFYDKAHFYLFLFFSVQTRSSAIVIGGVVYSYFDWHSHSRSLDKEHLLIWIIPYEISKYIRSRVPAFLKTVKVVFHICFINFMFCFYCCCLSFVTIVALSCCPSWPGHSWNRDFSSQLFVSLVK